MSLQKGEKVNWDGWPDDESQIVEIVDIREHMGHEVKICQIKVESGLVLMTTEEHLKR